MPRREHPVEKFIRLSTEAHYEQNAGHRRVLRRAAARAKLAAQAWMAEHPREAAEMGFATPVKPLDPEEVRRWLEREVQRAARETIGAMPATQKTADLVAERFRGLGIPVARAWIEDEKRVVMEIAVPKGVG